MQHFTTNLYTNFIQTSSWSLLHELTYICIFNFVDSFTDEFLKYVLAGRVKCTNNFDGIQNIQEDDDYNKNTNEETYFTKAKAYLVT